MEQTTDPGPASFAMCCCAVGAENPLKRELAEQGWRLAFSRPGFVTVKHPGQAELPGGVFVRTAADSLGQLKHRDGQLQLNGLAELLAKRFPRGKAFDELHVWPRDRVPVGKFGFEPGIDEVSKAVAEEIHQTLGAGWLRSDRPNRIAEPDASVLDVVLVDPSHWFVGWHTAAAWPSRWPGGVQPIEPSQEPISRAYFKAAEAIAWSGFDVQPGDTVVEVGSAPGGACGRLLEMGLNVIGIDPAEMDPRVAGHPRFRHRRARAGDLPRKVFRDVDWLLTDSNVKPEKTLTTLQHIVTHRECSLRGLWVMMKLGHYDAAERIPQWKRQIEQWDPLEVRVRQLARNRCEVCFAIRLRPR